MNKEVLDFFLDILNSNNINIYKIAPPYTTFHSIGEALPQTQAISEIFNTFILYLRDYFQASQKNTLYFYSDLIDCWYVGLHLPEADDILFIGPILLEKMSDESFHQLYTKANLPEEFFPSVFEYHKHAPTFFNFETFLNTFSIFADYLYGPDKYEIKYKRLDWLNNWLSIEKSKENIQKSFHQNISDIEYRYELEEFLINAVISTNETLAIQIINQFTSKMLPSRLDNELRNQKNYCITLNTLLRKAVQEAGVHPIHIDAYSNSMIQQIEELHSPSECELFMKKMVHIYCELIRDQNFKKYPVLIQNIITYVQIHLDNDLSLNVLAKQFSVNASYLSSLFRKETGTSLTDYVNHLRIENAKKLLLLTQLPIKSIAMKCGIWDVCYFNRLFKRYTSTTPNAYRKQGSQKLFFPTEKKS